MTFKPAIWYPIAVLGSIINVVSVWFASAPAHATTHAVLAVGFGLWAVRLRQGTGGGDLQARLEGLEADVTRLDALEGEMMKLRQELGDANERLDFAERILAQGREAGRVGPQR
jgi:hypothetical protein